MSLDVHLYIQREPKEIKCECCGQSRMDDGREEVYWANITHNLGRMAGEAGIYEALWRPEEIPVTYSKEIIGVVEQGLTDMKARPEHYETFNAPNGWGSYKYFVPFVEKYLDALKQFPNAKIESSR